MSRTIGAVTTDYVWDLARDLPVILEDSDGVRYVYGLDLIARINGSTEDYYLADGLGSTTALTDDTGNVSVEYAYDAFGNYRPGEGSSANEFTYAGEQVDETGLQYLRARYYDPSVGRFLSQDRVPYLQRYTYVANNPARFVDPYGQALCDYAGPLSGACEAVRGGVGCLIRVDGRCLADQGIGWLPSGQFSIMGISVSYQEAATCGIYPEQCAIVFGLAEKANRETASIYGYDVGEGSIGGKESAGDAFQHCFWSGSITLILGADRAEVWTTRHEAKRDNPPQEVAFDLENNRRGREFGESLRPRIGHFGSVPILFGFDDLSDLCRG